MQTVIFFRTFKICQFDRRGLNKLILRMNFTKTKKKITFLWSNKKVRIKYNSSTLLGHQSKRRVTVNFLVFFFFIFHLLLSEYRKSFVSFIHHLSGKGDLHYLVKSYYRQTRLLYKQTKEHSLGGPFIPAFQLNPWFL